MDKTIQIFLIIFWVVMITSLLIPIILKAKAPKVRDDFFESLIGHMDKHTEDWVCRYGGVRAITCQSLGLEILADNMPILDYHLWIPVKFRFSLIQKLRLYPRIKLIIKQSKKDHKEIQKFLMEILDNPTKLLKKEKKKGAKNAKLES